MNTTAPRPWFPVAIAFGIAYLADGLVTNVFDRTAPPDLVRPIRLASWIVAAVAFAAHIGYERYRLGSPSRATALHAATGAAFGAFLLAAAGLVRGQGTSAGHQARMGLALVVWPLVVGVPAFLAALAAASILPRLRR